MSPLYAFLLGAVLVSVTAHPDTISTSRWTPEERRVKRQGLGGWKEEDPNDPMFAELARVSMEKYNDDHFAGGIPIVPRDIIVTRARSQPVAGTNYFIDFNVYAVGGGIYGCNSKIYETWERRNVIKDIKTDCIRLLSR